MLSAPAPTLSEALARLLISLLTVFTIAVYWSPTVVAVVRRHPRIGLVLLYNFLGVFVAPWFIAWTVVLAEPSHRPGRARPVPPVDPHVIPFQRNGGSAA